MLVIKNGNVTRSEWLMNEGTESTRDDQGNSNTVAEAAEALGLPKRSTLKDVLAKVEDRR